MTATHSATATQPLLVWHDCVPVLLPTSAAAASPSSSLANSPPGRGSEHPGRAVGSPPSLPQAPVQSDSPGSPLPTLPPAARRDSPGFPQSAHREFSALLHTSFRAFTLLSFPPAMASRCYPSGQGRAAYAFCTCRPPSWAAQGRRSQRRARSSCRRRKKEKAGEAVRLMEGARRPDGTPGPAQRRQG